MVKWARKNNMTVLIHTGGTSIPGSDTVTAEQVIATDPDVACHVNGGPTAMSSGEIRKLINDTKYAIELVHCGNPKALLDAVNMGLDSKALSRFIIGNDAPSGTGVIPLGILRVICMVASLSTVTPEQAICMATGNTAKVFKLDTGVVQVGAPALDAIKVGDIPGVSMVMIDGKVHVKTSRNTPPAAKKPSFN
jgi:enamidase